MISRSALTVCLLSLLTTGSALAQHNPPMEEFDAEGSDPEAIAIADRVMEHLGGRDAWDRTRYLTWSFFGDDQVWDKWTGRFRWQEDSVVVLMNINTMAGRAFSGGVEVTDNKALDDLLVKAHRNWANSSYWLLMPYKLKDSGVTLRHAGRGTMQDGRAADVITLTFKDVGYTPHNRYEVRVDTETGLVGEWSYYADAADEEPRFTVPWLDWRQFGEIMLSDNRGIRANGEPFMLPNVAVFDALSDAVFDDPAKIDLSEMR